MSDPVWLNDVNYDLEANAVPTPPIKVILVAPNYVRGTRARRELERVDACRDAKIDEVRVVVLPDDIRGLRIDNEYTQVHIEGWPERAPHELALRTELVACGWDGIEH